MQLYPASRELATDTRPIESGASKTIRTRPIRGRTKSTSHQFGKWFIPLTRGHPTAAKRSLSTQRIVGVSDFRKHPRRASAQAARGASRASRCPANRWPSPGMDANPIRIVTEPSMSESYTISAACADRPFHSVTFGSEMVVMLLFGLTTILVPPNCSTPPTLVKPGLGHCSA